jgi:hypothetical protein
MMLPKPRSAQYGQNQLNHFKSLLLFALLLVETTSNGSTPVLKLALVATGSCKTSNRGEREFHSVSGAGTALSGRTSFMGAVLFSFFCW